VATLIAQGFFLQLLICIAVYRVEQSWQLHGIYSDNKYIRLYGAIASMQVHQL